MALLSAIAFAVERPLRAMHLLPAPRLLHRRRLVVATRLVGELALQSAIMLEARPIELAGFNRGADGAAGLAVVDAIGEAARLGERRDVGERRLDPIVAGPRLQLAHARRVDQQR